MADINSPPQPPLKLDADSIELAIPTEEDVPSLASMKDLAFAEKRGCLISSAESKAEFIQVYRTYAASHPRKLEHCRVVRDDQSNQVIGACQLQLAGDVGDLTLPAMARHKLRPGEAYVEWIACHPDHAGKGIGSKLLEWAANFAKNEGEASVLSLEVMKKNAGAKKLYERKGFIWKRGKDNPHHSDYDSCDEWCDWFFSGLFVFCCLGCQYWTVCYMEKDLSQ